MTDFVKETKLTELENKISHVSSLAKKTALTAVKNKIPSVSSFMKKMDYATKITEIEKKLTDHNNDKYITTPEINTLAASVFNARLDNKNRFWSKSYFIGKSHFEEDSTHNYLVFQPINKYFKVTANTNYVSSWKSKGLSAENIMPPTPSSNSLTPALSYYGTRTRVKFNGSCLKH